MDPDREGRSSVKRGHHRETRLTRNSVYHEESQWGPICRVRPIGLVDAV